MALHMGIWGYNPIGPSHNSTYNWFYSPLWTIASGCLWGVGGYVNGRWATRNFARSNQEPWKNLFQEKRFWRALGIHPTLDISFKNPIFYSRWMVEPTHLNQKYMQVKFANHFLIHKTSPRFKLERKLKLWCFPKGISSSKPYLTYCWWFRNPMILYLQILQCLFYPR